MQMTNYRAYLKGKASGTSLSKQELKLRAAKRSGDPKKIEEVLSQLLGVEVATTRIPYLEGEEIFGSTKPKLDLSPSLSRRRTDRHIRPSVRPSVTSDKARVHEIRVNGMLTSDRVKLGLLCPQQLPHCCHVGSLAIML
jgi:hypothetical protein